MVHVHLVMHSLRATGDLGLGTLTLHDRQAGAGARRRHWHRAETGIIDLSARGAGKGSRCVGAAKVTNRLLTRVATIELADGVFLGAVGAVNNGGLGVQ